MIWFLEGQSSQRDVIEAARRALPAEVKVYASHRQHRPEITGQADLAWREPADDAERIAWVLAQAQRHGVRVVLAGRAGQAFEPARAAFEAAGIQLVTGALSLASFERVDDKGLFTDAARAAGLACAESIVVETAEQLQRAIDQLAASGPVCVKPTHGIYGQGFWRLSADNDPFSCFANPDSRQVQTAAFVDAYARSLKPKPQLVMRYLPGQECSVDMVCEAGVVVAWVARRKAGTVQRLEHSGPAVELALGAAAQFGCDGIVNVQTREDAEGRPYLLEINPRPSGGIGYTALAGINLPGIFATRRLGLAEPRSAWRTGVTVKALTTAVAVSEPALED
ncbi:MAG: ATP-grasp domain-containing protein [Pseudomonas sp.]|uniref:ATP-grasp domain-containing protein n=1 Tax=Pseudomonas sp. TaxID=306 RepID=UPI003391FCFE